MRKLFLLFFICLCVFPEVLAQHTPSIYGMASKINDFYPVSVEAAALFKKVPEEVDYCRGKVTVRIPLYEIKTPSFTLPITLSYTTGGIKVGELNGAVALGWRLEAEPIITREIRGLPDELSFLRDSTYMKTNNALFYSQVGQGIKDLQCDIFHYRTLSSSGKFILNMTDKLAFHPNVLTEDPVQLTVPGGCATEYFQNSINLVDNYGTRYVFGESSYARESTTHSDGISYNTSWKVSSIESVDGERMSFSYNTALPQEYHPGNYDYYAVEHTIVPNISPLVPPSGYWKGVNGIEQYYTPGQNGDSDKTWGDPQPYPVGDSYVTIRYLENITFLNGSVSFNYSNRTKTLESICVYNNSGTLIREINIETTLREYNRVLLDRIRIKGISGSDSQVYEFNYRLPALDYSPYTKGVDYWGYYNGQEGNTDLIPNQRVPLYNTGVIVDSVTIGGAYNRLPSLANTLAYSLEKITYSTGGNTVFYYSQNTILNDARMSEPAGGARIDEIVENSGSGENIVRKFKYHLSNSSSIDAGSLRYPMTGWAFRKKMQKLYLFDGQSFRNDYTLYLGQNIFTNDNDVYYDDVEEYCGDVLTKHVYPYAANHFSWEYLQNENNALYYSSAVNQGDNITGYGTHHFGNQNANSERLDSHSSKMVSLDDLERKVIIQNYGGGTNMEERYRSSYEIKTYFLNLTSPRVSYSLQIDSLPGGKQQEQTSYVYGNNTTSGQKYNQLYKIIRTAPGGDTYKTEYSYPFDKAETPYDIMVAKNAVSFPVEERRYRNDELKKTIRYVYRADENTQSGFSLAKIMESSNDANTEFRDTETYDVYLSCGRPLQVTRQDGTVVCFIWGYGGQYVLAIIENLDIMQISEKTGLEPENVVKGNISPEAVHSALKSLRGTCPQAKITLYNHTPLVGTTEVNHPNGSGNFNVYDSLGRLTKVLDTDHNIVKTYDYHVVNPISNN